MRARKPPKPMDGFEPVVPLMKLHDATMAAYRAKEGK